MAFPAVVKQLLHSEKAVATGLLVLAVSILLIMGRITAEQWMSYTQVLLGIYVGGKTVQGAASVLSKRSPAAVEEDDAPVPLPLHPARRRSAD